MNRSFKAIAFALVAAFISLGAVAQSVAINTTGATADASAILDISSTNKGILVPRVALTAANSPAPLAAPLTSLLIYNTATAGTAPNNVTPGYYYWNGTAWSRLISGTDNNQWQLLGNAGTVDGTHFIGTTDNVPLNFKVNGQKAGRIGIANEETFFGYGAGANNTGSANTFLGNKAGNLNTTGSYAVAVGDSALFTNTNRSALVAIGFTALANNNTGDSNTAVGYRALYANTGGSRNTAMGENALTKNTTGNSNTAIGQQSLMNNTSGGVNSAVGNYTLMSNTTGSNNTAFGTGSLRKNTTGSFNNASGIAALKDNTTGDFS